MSVKKLLILAAASVVSASALAGGVDTTYSAPVASSAAPASNLYVQVQAGYAQTDWKKQSSVTANWSKGNGGLAYGVDVGYAWNRNLALEIGGFNLAKVKNNGDTSTIKNYVAYGAVKLSVPVYDSVDLYTKVGVGYNRAKIAGTTITGLAAAGTYKQWGFTGGVGVDYSFGNNVFANIQYMKFAGKERNASRQVTSPSIWTVGVGYKFQM